MQTVAMAANAGRWTAVMGIVGPDAIWSGLEWVDSQRVDTCPAEDRLQEAQPATEDAKTELAARLIRQAGPAAEVRMELVLRLRQEIQAGTYRVDAAEVAGRLMLSLGVPAQSGRR